jgi:hypothetical protein
MSKKSDSLLSPRSARSGALWGAGIFLILWLGMYDTLGEILLLLPALYIPGMILRFFGIDTTWDSMVWLWRGVGVIINVAIFSLIGARCGLSIFQTFEKLPRLVRIIVVLFLAIVFVSIVFIGRGLRIH